MYDETLSAELCGTPAYSKLEACSESCQIYMMESYLELFRTMCNPIMFRTLAYSEYCEIFYSRPCGTLACSEPAYIRNSDKF